MIKYIGYLVIFIFFAGTAYYLGILQTISGTITGMNDKFFKYIPTEFKFVGTLLVFGLLWIFIQNRQR